MSIKQRSGLTCWTMAALSRAARLAVKDSVSMLQTNGMQRYIAIVLGFSPLKAQLEQRHGATSLRCVHDWSGGEACCGVAAESNRHGNPKKPCVLLHRQTHCIIAVHAARFQF